MGLHIRPFYVDTRTMDILFTIEPIGGSGLTTISSKINYDRWFHVVGVIKDIIGNQKFPVLYVNGEKKDEALTRTTYRNLGGKLEFGNQDSPIEIMNIKYANYTLEEKEIEHTGLLCG